jgi:polar amino acid transport system substrate-binding protein
VVTLTLRDGLTSKPHSTHAAAGYEMLPVLLADTNDEYRLAMVRQIERLGYRVHAVASGYAALEVLSAAPDGFSLILMDCEMPEINGLEATRSFRRAGMQAGRHIPIVVLTSGSAQPAWNVRALADIDDMLTRPVKPETLRAVLNRWIYAASPQADEA